MSRSPVAFGPYVITRRIARGGMAEIFRAKRRGAGARGWVALKMMRPTLEHEALREQLFHREARIAALIHHPNVVELLEFGEAEGHKYLAMEYMRGRDLSHLIHTGDDGGGQALPPDVALTIVMEAASGLGHAHRLVDPATREHLAIVHRDISPGNVMVGYDGSIKVLDFGVARINETSGMRTQTGTLRGKFAYMSPEQTVGSTVDARSDVFSLGTVLYELLTGSNPFRARNAMTTIERVQRVRPVPPSRSNRLVPRELDELLARCLAKDPRRRFADAAELQAAIAGLPGHIARAPAASISDLMRGRFAWAQREEDKELAEEEESAALIEVIDFAVGGEDSGLDAPNVAVSEEDVAEPSAIGVRREQIEAVAEEDALGVFDSADEERTVAQPSPLTSAENRRAMSAWPARTPTPPRVREAASAMTPAPATVEPPRVPGPRAISPTPLPTPVPVHVIGEPIDERPAAAPAFPFAGDGSTGSRRKFEVVRGEVARGPIPSAPAAPRDDPTALGGAVALESVGREETDALLRALRDQSAPSARALGRRASPVVWVASFAALAAVVLGAVGWAIASARREDLAHQPKKIAPVSIALEPTPTPVPEPTSTPVELTAARSPTPSPAVDEAPLPDGDSAEPEGEGDTDAAPSKPSRGERSRELRRRLERAKRPAATGFLNVGAKPWAEIEIDGKKWPYQTPQAGIELPVGKHVVRLSNRETGVSKTTVVHIRAGAYRTVSLDMRGD